MKEDMDNGSIINPRKKVCYHYGIRSDVKQMKQVNFAIDYDEGNQDSYRGFRLNAAPCVLAFARGSEVRHIQIEDTEGMSND